MSIILAVEYFVEVQVMGAKRFVRFHKYMSVQRTLVLRFLQSMYDSMKVCAWNVQVFGRSRV